MHTEEVDRGQFDKAVEATETIQLIVANIHRIDEEIERAEKHVSELFTRVKGLNNTLEVLIERTKHMDEVNEVSAHVVEGAKTVESAAIMENNISEPVSKKKQSTKPEIADTRLYEPNKKVEPLRNALKEKILDTICVFGRKYKDLTFREILNREGGEDFVRRLAKSQSMLAEDCAYLVKCLEEEEE